MTSASEDSSGDAIARASRLPAQSDVLTGELADRGHWVVANITGSLFWPTVVQKAHYRGFDIFIVPPTLEGHLPRLAIKMAAGQDDGEARRGIMGFLSALCWVNYHRGARVETWTGGSGVFGALGPRTTTLTSHPLELDYLPDPTDPKARLALALCREAAAVNQATYAVISYFRVFETHFQRTARDIKDWLNANAAALKDTKAQEILARLTASQPDVGHYLYDACRSAAAHGKIGSSKIIDPDDPEDERRLMRDLPLIRALAIKLTEEILGIQTTSTVYQEHLYELAGFKTHFSRKALDAFAAGGVCSADEIVDFPAVSLGLSDQPPYAGLCGLTPVHLQAVAGGVKAVFQRDDGLVELQLFLNVQAERLEFEISQDLRMVDDGTPEAMEVAASVHAFQKDYFMNGRLRVHDFETGELLGRKDAFMPLNVIVNPDGFDAQIAKLRQMAEHRRALRQKVWSARVSPAQVTYSYDPANAALPIEPVAD